MIVGWVVRVSNGRMFGPFPDARSAENFIRRYFNSLTGTFTVEPLFDPDIGEN